MMAKEEGERETKLATARQVSSCAKRKALMEAFTSAGRGSLA